MLVWYDGELKEYDEVSVPLLAHSLHYGDAAFEGIRGYKLENGNIGIFRLPEHSKRMEISIKILMGEKKLSAEEIADASVKTVRANKDLGDMYIRPIYYLAEGTLGLSNIGKCKPHFAVATIPFPPLLGDKPIRIHVSDWRKMPSQSVPVMAKLSTNYVNSILATREAQKAGYDESLFLNIHGRVAEGPGENFFIVKGKRVITPPPSEDILEGITRNTVMELARDLGYEVLERPISLAEVFFADEAFFTGTAAEVVPIKEVNGVSIGNGDAGEVTSKLRSLYKDVVRGKVEKYKHWITEVNE